jgi:drug/metabolite transporter (DMT)-like permease
VVQVAVFSAVLLDETLRPFGWLATVLCLSGVVLLAGGRTLLRHPDRAALFGLLAGTGFGLAAIGIRAATRSLGDAPAFVRAIVALAVMNTMQTVIHGGYLAVRERGQIRLAFLHWRSSSVVGVLSVCGSACFAWAFALQNAAKVRTFGQVELLFTFAVAHWWLHERTTRRQYAGAALVLAGVLGVMIAG